MGENLVFSIPPHPRLRSRKDSAVRYRSLKLGVLTIAGGEDLLRGELEQQEELWNELCSGAWRVLDAFSTEERCYAVLEQPAGNRRQRVHGLRLQILESVLLGQSPKAVAIDLQVSPSTVAAALRRCLRTMGLQYRMSNLPVLLVMAARAARSHRNAAVAGRIARMDQDGATRWVVSIPRLSPDN